MTQKRDYLTISRTLLKEYPEARVQPCMRCVEPFISKHKFNRLCGRCGNSSAVQGFSSARALGNTRGGRVGKVNSGA